MPTLADLHKALDRLEAEAPAAAATRRAVLSRVESGSRRPAWTQRTGPLLVAAVAILAALATVVVIGLRGGVDLAEPVDRPTGSPFGPPPAATELTWTFDLPEPPVGTTFRRLTISADRQIGSLGRIDRAADLLVTVHAPGAFDPTTEMKQRRPVKVEGQEGYFGPVWDGEYGSLVWPSPEGGWVQLYGFGLVPTAGPDIAPKPEQVLAEQLSVAELVRFGRFGSPRLPFKLGWLPSGISVQGASSGAQGTTVDATFGSASFSDAGPVTVGVGTILVTRVDISRGSFAEELNDVVGPDRTALTVGGRPAVTGSAVDQAHERPVGGPAPLLDARVLAVDLGDGSVLLVLVGNPAVDRYPVDVLTRIAEEADVSMSMADPSTWIPAPEAVAG